MRKCTLAALLLPVACCAQSKFLDMWVGQVRGDQTAQFDAFARKMADANRKAKDKGDFGSRTRITTAFSGAPIWCPRARASMRSHRPNQSLSAR